LHGKQNQSLFETGLDYRVSEEEKLCVWVVCR